jgi:hypothetical protein
MKFLLPMFSLFVASLLLATELQLDRYAKGIHEASDAGGEGDQAHPDAQRR